MTVIIEPLGDHALTVKLGEIIDEKINKKVLALFHYLQQKNIEEVKDYIPAYASLTVVYDIAEIKKHHALSAFEYMHNMIEDALRNFNESLQVETTLIHIPVCYDVSLGIDLKEMAGQKNITIEEIVELHTAVTYRVYMIGFLPGFAYMGKVNTKIAAPRKAVPRKNVNAGSVGIADFQTGIYPFNSPGGWNIIGQTPLQIFNSTYTEPCVLQPGDTVKFEPISLEEFEDLKS
jgi:inhibitor of KinA